MGRVAIENDSSDVVNLCDVIFQGTVLGPTLWSTIFHDVAGPTSSADGQVALFADDLIFLTAFAFSVPNP